ncbi:MAG: right-handed parallel beta-helix repeat-containing protein [Thermogutta sp.]
MTFPLFRNLPTRCQGHVRRHNVERNPHGLPGSGRLLWIGLMLVLVWHHPVFSESGHSTAIIRESMSTGGVAQSSPSTLDLTGSRQGLMPFHALISLRSEEDLAATATTVFRPGEVQNVRTVGAIGDGEHDDTEAIQKCIARGGAILFPPGTYRITRPLEVSLTETGWIAFHGFGTARLLMAGAGPAIRIMGTHTGSADPKRVHPGVWQQERFPLIEGLEIVGEHPDSCGIEAVQTMQLTIVKTLIRETYHAIRLHNRNRNVLLSDCHIYHNRGVGVFLDDVDLHQINIVGCHISYNAAGGVVVKKGYLRNLQVAGCDIEANMSVETEPTANIFIDSRESQYGHAEIAITGCTIQHYSKVPGSCNIRFFGQDVQGRLWGNLTIAENVLSDVERNVEIIGARGVSITGNTFWGAVAEDLLVTDSRNIVIGPNSFDQNPNYSGQGPYRGGVTLQNCQDCVITGLQLASIRGTEGALVVRDCHGVNITNCQLIDCLPIGILLDQVADSRVSGCIIRTLMTSPQENVGADVSGTQTEEAVALCGKALNNIMICGNLIRGKMELPNTGVKLEGNLTLPPLP